MKYAGFFRNKNNYKLSKCPTTSAPYYARS
jgi:hypothetical protein